MRAALRKLYAWEPLQRYEVWREERICRRVSDYPETFRWV